MEDRQLNHYGYFRFTDDFWKDPNRKEFLEAFTKQASELAGKVNFYTIYPARPEVDLMIWSALQVEDHGSARDFFQRCAQANARWQPKLKPVDSLWGFTRPSMYAKGKSPQQLDAFDGERRPYLVIYPFTKTHEWYQLSREDRQAMMNEHIKTGKQYTEITQLLLYSTGLQDQEFVVVYETDELPMFSQLVTDLRASKARPYTLADTPIYTATYVPMDAVSALFG